MCFFLAHLLITLHDEKLMSSLNLFQISIAFKLVNMFEKVVRKIILMMSSNDLILKNLEKIIGHTKMLSTSFWQNVVFNGVFNLR
jgi:hypothetical protein